MAAGPELRTGAVEMACISFTTTPSSGFGAGPLLAGGGESDPMYDQAVAIVLQHKRASISLVQRHLRIGYNRAARLLEQMEKSGLVSAMSTNGNRDIIVPNRDA